MDVPEIGITDVIRSDVMDVEHYYGNELKVGVFVEDKEVLGSSSFWLCFVFVMVIIRPLLIFTNSEKMPVKINYV